MPPISFGQYIVDCWFEIGLSNTDKTPIAWVEINAFKQATETPLNTQELSLIRKLSREYCNQYHESSFNNESDAPFKTQEAIEAIEKANAMRDKLALDKAKK